MTLAEIQVTFHFCGTRFLISNIRRCLLLSFAQNSHLLEVLPRKKGGLIPSEDVNVFITDHDFLGNLIQNILVAQSLSFPTRVVNTSKSSIKPSGRIYVNN